MVEALVIDDKHPRALATINLPALVANLKLAITSCPDAEVIPVIKANAYGHGVEEVAAAIVDANMGVKNFAVATFCEAIALRQQFKSLNNPGASTESILLLGGFSSASELTELLAQKIDPVVHTFTQVKQLVSLLESQVNPNPSHIWLKLDTGMHRLGMTESECVSALSELFRALKKTGREKSTNIVIMSHLASADNGDDTASIAQTKSQLALFKEAAIRLKETSSFNAEQFSASLAASTGILSLPEAHYDYVRPGVMLYGASPFANRTAEEIGLQPVMTLSSRIVAIRDLQAGECIGYGGTYTCKKPMRMAVVSIGYADGYPRSASDGTPVLVRIGGSTGNKSAQRTTLIGRVSMDMITIDLTDISDAQIGDEVVLWGEGLPADEVASHAGSIGYELFCRVTARVSFHYR